MKVLILVQSFDGENEYRRSATGEIIKFNYMDLLKVQRETWDSVKNPDVQTFYYMPDAVKSGIEGDIIYIKARPDFKYMFLHMVKAMQYAMQFEWDYLFKTDNSAYVCKAELVNILKNKPRTGFYGGMPYTGPGHQDQPFFWGEGTTLSRDVVQRIIDVAALNFPVMGIDDGVMGMLLKDRATWDDTMTIHQYYRDPFKVSHVYRCKNDAGIEGTVFEDDIKAMREIHESLSVSNVV
jgi:hypothetical protein